MSNESVCNRSLSLGRRHFLAVGAGAVVAAASGTRTMQAAEASAPRIVTPPAGNSRAISPSEIEKILPVPEVWALGASLSNITERAGFEPAVG